MGRRLWRVGGAGSGKHTHTHTHTHSVPRDTQGGWRLGQGLDSILANAGVAGTLIKLMGCEHREDAMGGGGSRKWCTHTLTHTHTHSVARDTQSG